MAGTKTGDSKSGEKRVILSEVEYVLKLYVTGATPNSLRAITNIKSICEEHLQGKYWLEIIDIYKDQERASREQIVALPMLIKLLPHPERKMIGDLSNTTKVLHALSIKN